MGRLTGKTALVTGAAKGIGKAIALQMAAEGAHVIVNFNGSLERANQTVEEIVAAGGSAEVYQCDVSDYSAVTKMIGTIIEKCGKLDVLLNNAGITRDGLLMRMSEEMFDDVIAANLKGCFNCMQVASRYMIKARSGRIINMSSVSGVLGNAGQVNYSASKAGIIGMTKSAAREMAARGITVNAIAPGFIATDMTAILSEKAKEAILASIPLGYMGTPEDIAATAVFLASDEAKYITGQTISVDGGMSMQ